MNQSLTAPGLIAARAACQRSNDEQRLIVDHGVAVQARSSTISAIEYLKAHRIDPHLIERVLLEPHRRRPYTP